jgi:hypothetical protein
VAGAEGQQEQRVRDQRPIRRSSVSRHGWQAMIVGPVSRASRRTSRRPRADQMSARQLRCCMLAGAAGVLLLVGAVAVAAGAASHHVALRGGAVAGPMRADDAQVLPPGFFEVIRTDGRAVLQVRVGGGNVTTAVSDGRGGWYIGGFFHSINGRSRSGLAHLLATGVLDPQWHPRPSLGGDTTFFLVRSLLLNRQASTLYVTGAFDAIDGTPRNGIAAVDPISGALLSWEVHSKGEVGGSVLEDPDGHILYLSGRFTFIGGHSREHIAAVDEDSAIVLSLNIPGLKLLGNCRVGSEPRSTDAVPRRYQPAVPESPLEPRAGGGRSSPRPGHALAPARASDRRLEP